MFNLGFSEMLIIGVIALLVLGPDKLPKAMKTVAEWVTYLRRSVNDIKHQVNDEFEKAAGDDLKKDFYDIKKIGSEFKDIKSMGSEGFLKFMERGSGEDPESSAKPSGDTPPARDAANLDENFLEVQPEEVVTPPTDPPESLLPKPDATAETLSNGEVPLEDFIKGNHRNSGQDKTDA